MLSRFHAGTLRAVRRSYPITIRDARKVISRVHTGAVAAVDYQGSHLHLVPHSLAVTSSLQRIPGLSRHLYCSSSRSSSGSVFVSRWKTECFLEPETLGTVLLAYIPVELRRAVSYSRLVIQLPPYIYISYVHGRPSLAGSCQT